MQILVGQTYKGMYEYVYSQLQIGWHRISRLFLKTNSTNQNSANGYQVINDKYWYSQLGGTQSTFILVPGRILCAPTDMCTCMCVRVFVRVGVRACVSLCERVCVCHVCIHIHMYTYICHTYIVSVCLCVSLFVYHLYIHIHIHIHTFILYTRAYIYCIHIYTYMHICVYIYYITTQTSWEANSYVRIYICCTRTILLHNYTGELRMIYYKITTDLLRSELVRTHLYRRFDPVPCPTVWTWE